MTTDTAPVAVTGIDELDEALSGGLRPGRCYLVSGPAGFRKSSIIVQTAWATAARIADRNEPGFVMLASAARPVHDLAKAMACGRARTLPVYRLPTEQRPAAARAIATAETYVSGLPLEMLGVADLAVKWWTTNAAAEALAVVADRLKSETRHDRPPRLVAIDTMRDEIAAGQITRQARASYQEAYPLIVSCPEPVAKAIGASADAVIHVVPETETVCRVRLSKNGDGPLIDTTTGFDPVAGLFADAFENLTVS